jgi:hypothetical protein
MYIDIVPNRGSPPAILLRESYREDGKTRKRTLDLSAWSAERIDQLRAVLRGETLLPARQAIEIIRALLHGHVLAALGTARRIELEALLPPLRQAQEGAATAAGSGAGLDHRPPAGAGGEARHRADAG